MISSLSPLEEYLWAAIIPSLHTSQDNQRDRADSSGREVSIATTSCKMVAGIAGTLMCLSVLSKMQERMVRKESNNSMLSNWRGFEFTPC